MPLMLLVLLSGCQRGDDGGLPKPQRMEHLQVLEQESRLNEVPIGAKPVKSIRRLLCKDMDSSNRSLAIGRDYEFSGPRSEALEFHGAALTRAGWVLSQPASLEKNFTSAVYMKTFDNWEGRVIISFTGSTVSVGAEDLTSPVC
ncbi:MAG: hypothetical protein ABR564_08825 [Candidatus Dormibacteria bacterium]